MVDEIAPVMSMETEALKIAMAIPAELARTALGLIRLVTPSMPMAEARVEAITLLLTSCRMICNAVPPLPPEQTAVMKVYEKDFRIAAEGLVRELLPELAEYFDLRQANSRIEAAKADVRGSLQKLIPEIEEDDGDGNE